LTGHGESSTTRSMSSHSERGPRRSTPPGRLGWPLRALYFAVFGAIGAYSPYFPLWLEQHGFRGLSMSLVAALAPAMSALGPPLIGILADRRGARGNLLTIAGGLACLSMLCLWVAERANVEGFAAVVFAMVLLFALSRTTLTMMADVIALEEGADYGRRRLWGSVGYMLATLSVGWLLREAGIGWLPAIVAVPLFGATLASLALPERAPPPRASAAPAGVRELLADRRFVVFLSCSALTWAAHSGYDLCGPLFLRDLGASSAAIGALWGLGVLAEVLLMANAATLFAKRRAEALLVIAYGGGALRWFGIAQLPSVQWAFVLQPLHALSFALMWVASVQYVRRWADRGLLASSQGLLTASVAAGGVCGMLVWGPLYAGLGGRTVFVLAGCLALTSTAIAALTLLRPEPLPSAP
jgi:MFS transporter, PPP family, 3-phenylpropionic acid transporter